MSAISAHLFAYVQGADFYRTLHREAVALMPTGAGQTWFDIGSGAGLVATLAHQQGYNATGFDRDAHMVREAQRRSARSAGLRFVECGLRDLVARHGRAEVVSAASLLSVLPDRSTALKLLLDAVAPGGALLVVETSGSMACAPWDREKRRLATGRRRWVLRLWARVRQGTHAVDIAALCPQGYDVQKHSLLGGLVNAWIVRQSHASAAHATAAPECLHPERNGMQGQASRPTGSGRTQDGCTKTEPPVTSHEGMRPKVGSSLVAGLIWREKAGPDLMDLRVEASGVVAVPRSVMGSGPSSQAPQIQRPAFRCDGRKYCSQMTSCEDAKVVLNNCPGTEMDGRPRRRAV